MMSNLFNPKWITAEVTAYRKRADIPILLVDQVNFNLSKLIGHPPLVSIVIPAWNEEVNIILTIESLARSKVQFPIEIIVVDNNSTDDTAKSVGELNVTYIRQEIQGCGPARQMGQEYAKGKYILMADADCFYPSHWIQGMIEKLKQEGVSCVYGRYSFLGKSKLDRVKYYCYEKLRDVLVEFRHKHRPYLNSLGMSMGYVKEYGIKIGFIGSTLRGEDGRMCFELMEFGKIVLVRDHGTRVWTQPRTLQKEGSLMVSLLARMLIEIPRLSSYLKKRVYHDTKQSKNTNPSVLKYFKKYRDVHKKDIDIKK